ncbi:MAG: hypothetical protein E6Q85_01720 [Thiothrix sp.]|nr:MAG: hypothetical protein E6Q85_01720 [Thiothrix sp.]
MGKRFIPYDLIRTAAYGRWDYIHRALGINLQTTSHRKHTPCPACGGKDRFRVQADYADLGRWFCGGGGDPQAGDGFTLLGHVHGWDTQQQFNAVAELLGIATLNRDDAAQLRAKARQQQAAHVAQAKAKTNRIRKDAAIIDALRDFDNALESRQRLQHTLRPRFVEPQPNEIAAAQELVRCLVASYAQGGATHV